MTDNDDLLFGNKSARLNSALTLFEKTHRDLEQDLQIIKDWIKTQPHLPETPSKLKCYLYTIVFLSNHTRLFLEQANFGNLN